MEEYVMRANSSIEELIVFAKKQKMPSSTVKALYKYNEKYKVYKKPFDKKQYLNSISLMVNGEVVKPTEEDVDICVDFLKERGSLVCDRTVRDTILKYKRGEIVIPNTKENETIEDEKQEEKENNSEEKEKILKW